MKNKIGAYADLIKYKLSAAVTLSAATGYLIFSPEITPGFFCLIAGLFCVAGGSSALNQYTEKKYDAIMERTKERPIPAKVIKEKFALAFAFLFFATGLTLLAFTGAIAAAIALSTVILYNFVYTSLKRVTVLAVLPGALVGALPPLIGYASAGGLCPGWEIITFAAFMFLWQIIHFLLIAIRYESDYRKAGFKIVSPFKNAFFLMFADKKRFRSAFLILNSISIAVMTGFIINSFISAA